MFCIQYDKLVIPSEIKKHANNETLISDNVILVSDNETIVEKSSDICCGDKKKMSDPEKLKLSREIIDSSFTDEKQPQEFKQHLVVGLLDGEKPYWKDSQKILPRNFFSDEKQKPYQSKNDNYPGSLFTITSMMDQFSSLANHDNSFFSALPFPVE